MKLSHFWISSNQFFGETNVEFGPALGTNPICDQASKRLIPVGGLIVACLALPLRLQYLSHDDGSA